MDGISSWKPVDYTCRRVIRKAGASTPSSPSSKSSSSFDFHNLKTEFLPRRNDIISLPQTS